MSETMVNDLNAAGGVTAERCAAFILAWDDEPHDPLRLATALYELRSVVETFHLLMMEAKAELLPPLIIAWDIEGLATAMEDPRFDDWRDDKGNDAFGHLRIVQPERAGPIWQAACDVFDVRHADD